MTLRIILVEPREAGNVGAAARVMKNFGFSSLTIAGEHPDLDPLAGWWASGADDVVASATFTPTLHAAMAGAHVTVATTSSRGRVRPADFDPISLARHFETLGADQTLALVFGREDRGLTGEELAACQYTAVIPTNQAFPTMNLAQSVGIFCFALSQIRPAEAARDLAQATLVERLHERAQALLVEVGFLHGNNPDRIYDDLRIIAGRAALDQREAEILLGMIRQIEWRLRRSAG
ncbi:MAG TPA: TrmJ/YjtD family RNA methyltransferase [Thermoanaerobaculia bacterium]|nr:TrmJ/YjtD family RNA methyltransferase [Thermoanaerobaculia bacterium]